MTPEFKAKLDAKISAYRAWVNGRDLAGVRMVEYCGIQMIGARDITLSEVEKRIKVAAEEGYGVEWTEYGKRIYLCLWEPWEPPGSAPDWSKVFAESDLEKGNV